MGANVTYRCGHEGWLTSKNLKNRSLEWHQEQLCIECYRKAQKEARDREREARIPEIEEMIGKLPPLQGTEKQLKWAQSLRLDVILYRVDQINYRKKRSQISPELVQGHLTALKNAVNSFIATQANWWIDHRGKDDDHPLLQTAVEEVKSIFKPQG